MNEKEPVKKFSISKILLEMFSVVFAIILALGVNEWRESAANKKLARGALIKIENEIKSNRDIVKKMLAHNRKYAEKQKIAFESIKEEIKKRKANKTEEQILSKFPFAFMTQTVKNTAWHSANLTHAVEYLDFSIVEALSATYGAQESYSRFNESMLEKLASPGLFRKETMISEFQAYFQSQEMYFQITESLIEDYENCSKVINEDAQ